MAAAQPLWTLASPSAPARTSLAATASSSSSSSSSATATATPAPQQGLLQQRKRAPTPAGHEPRRRELRQPRAPASLSQLSKRQLPYAEGYPDCNYVGNGVLSCFPFSNTTLVQDDWSKFIWNANFPEFIGAGSVDIYLYHADSETIATSYLGIDNSRGMIGIRPDDAWWPDETSWTEGQNQTWPYFFVIVEANDTITGGEEHQSTFVAVQTAAPATLVASLASRSSASSASAASISIASASSASLRSASISSASASASTRSNPNNALQDGNSNDSGGPGIPRWAIAVIVVLGFFALVAAAALAYFAMRKARRRRKAAEEQGDGSSSGRGSEQPIMSSSAAGGRGGAASALLAGGAAGVATRGAGGGGGGREAERRPTSGTSDGGGSSDAGPITHTDAAIMAEAFRKALRKPEFPSGETTPSPGAGAGTGMAAVEGQSGVVGEMGDDDEEDDDVAEEEDLRRRHRESGILGGSGGQGGEIWENEIRSEGRSLSSVQGGRRWGQQG